MAIKARKKFRKRTAAGHLPDHIDELYDSLAVKDLTRRKFRREYLRVMDPAKAQRDLTRMRVKLEVEKQMRRQIDGRKAQR